MTEKQMKVFMVEVEIRQQMPVVAGSREEAEEIAASNYEEDFDNGSERDASFSAMEIAAASADDKHTIPWGVRDGDPRRDWTIPQWLAAQNQGSAE